MTDTSIHTVDGPQGELRVQTIREGEGTRLLFLHSDGGRLEQWDEVIAALPESYPSARFDFRGHGVSAPAADQDYTFAGRADDVAAVLDALSWDRVLLVSHSGGNGAALEAIAAQPDRYLAHVMVDPPTDPAALPAQLRAEFVEGLAGPGSLDYLREYYRSIAGQNTAVVERVLTDAGATTADARAGLGPALLTWSADLVDRAELPRSVIGSDVTDGPAAIWQQRPSLSSRVVHGTGHWVNIERPLEVVADITALADQLR